MNGKISEGINMEKKTERILQLYRMLYEGKAITKSDLAARFDVNEKTIQRDIEDIRAFLDNKSGGKVKSLICLSECCHRFRRKN